MRLVTAAALALALAAAPAVAEVRVELQQGEVLLELDTRGSVRSPADHAVVTVPVTTRAASAAAARAAQRAQEQRLVAAARSAGVAAGDVRVTEPGASRVGFIGNAASVEVAAEAAAQDSGMPFPHQVELTVVEITLRNPARFEEVRAALEAAGASRVPNPNYVVRDESAARRGARAQAFARARADADAQAAAMNMRVVRVLRVSERLSAEAIGARYMENMLRQFGGGAASPSPEVETEAHLQVDFALVPR